MENKNDKDQLFYELWSKLLTAMENNIGENFIARSDTESDNEKINSTYFLQNKTIIENAMKNDATNEHDEKLTELLKKTGTNIFRYKFKERDKNIIREYRFSFEWDRMAVNIIDNIGKTIRYEFEYIRYSSIFFYSISRSLSKNDKDSLLFGKKNKYNSSIANTALKYYIDNIDYLAGMNVKDPFGAFIVFFESENLKFSKTLIKTFAEIGAADVFISSLLKIEKMPSMLENVLIGGNSEIVGNLIDKEIKNYEYVMPLLKLACANKSMNASLVQFLFDNYDNNLSKDSLIELFKYIYDPRIAKIVLNKLLNIDHNICDTDYDINIFCSIIESGSIEVMQYVLNEMPKISNGKQISDIINKKNSYGNTMLMKAIEENNTDMVKFLLFMPGIDVSVGNTEIPLLFTAIYNNNIEIFKLLLTNDKIDVTVTNKYGENLLHKAIKDKNVEIVKLLLSNNKIDVNIVDEIYKQTPLYTAVNVGSIEIVKLLLNNDKIDVNIVDEIYKQTPLYAAVCNNDTEIVKLLLTNDKIDVTVTNEYGDNLLHKAIENNNIEIFKFLLAKNKIDVTLTNKYRENLLHKAVRNGNIEIIKTLFFVQPNLDIYEIDDEGFSPLDYAIDYDKDEVFKYLLKIKAYHIIINIKDTNDKQKEINRQIEILRSMENKYNIQKTIKEFEGYFEKNGNRPKRE